MPNSSGSSVSIETDGRMIDDLDSLIDEVEAKYCGKKDNTESVRTEPRNSQRLNKEARFDEIDDILDALEDVELPSRKPATNSRLVRHQT
jgi:hypothetical protein